MFAIATVIIILILSLIIARIATVALTLTGLSRESAKFQARSAFTGVGFTTTEAEKAVNHPLRRRILMLLMLLGNAGIVTAMSSLILTFVNADSPTNWFWRLFWLVLGLGVIWFLATSTWLDQHLSPLISWLLKRWTTIDTRDYARILHLSGDYGVIELEVEPQDWLAHKTLRQLELSDEGVLVLGVQRQEGEYIGTPTGQTVVKPGDTLILYGRSPVLADIDQRDDTGESEEAHSRVVAEQQRLEDEQEELSAKQ
jgi:MFS family permease